MKTVRPANAPFNARNRFRFVPFGLAAAFVELFLSPGCEYDPSGLQRSSGQCGNSVIEAGEECDGPHMGGETCQSLGFSDGTLWCTRTCTFDTSQCVGRADCTGTCTPCESHSDEGNCGAQDGCAWNPGGCLGACAQCDTMTTEPMCSDQSGCMWDPENCSGTCLACGSIGQQDGCNKQAGCAWYDEECIGVPVPCANRTQSDCVDGCQWDQAGPCTGGSTVGCSFISVESVCTSVGCTWDMMMMFCSGGTFSCSAITDSSSCSFTGGQCSWDPAGPCSGVPDPCSGRSSSQCARGCNWVAAGCSGLCIECSGFDNGPDCTEQTGCTWDDEGPCIGACVECGSYDTSETNCTEQTGCTWSPSGQCTGNCTDCFAFTEENQCIEQSGCDWDPQQTTRTRQEG